MLLSQAQPKLIARPEAHVNPNARVEEAQSHGFPQPPTRSQPAAQMSGAQPQAPVPTQVRPATYIRRPMFHCCGCACGCFVSSRSKPFLTHDALMISPFGTLLYKSVSSGANRARDFTHAAWDSLLTL